MENFSQSAPVNMAPTGIATFAKCPICPDIRQIQADIAVIGAPCDMAIQGRPGARLGPRGIRTQSTRFRFSPQGSYDPERDDYYLSTEKWSVMDCGDIDYVPGDLEQTFGNIEAAVRLLRSRGCLPVVLGGDHSISIPVARGLDQSGPFHVIQLDAHLDWTDQLGGNRLFNGHPMRYMSQLPYVDRMAHLGIHGIGSSKRSDFQDARAYGATILSARQIRAMGAQKVLEQLPQGGRYYVTIDMQALVEMVDNFGGIEVYIPRDMSYGGSKLLKGYRNLDGASAEFFVRCRHGDGYANSDIDRLNMQRYFYAGLFKRARAMGITDILNQLPLIFKDYIHTDMDITTIAKLLASFLKIDSSNIILAQTPVFMGVPNVGKTDSFAGYSCVVPDAGSIANLLNQYFCTYTGPVEVSELHMVTDQWPHGSASTDANVQYMGRIDKESDDAILSGDTDLSGAVTTDGQAAGTGQ